MNIRKVLDLPVSNANCERGPIVEHTRLALSLRYDSEGELGEDLWTTIVFDGVLATRFTPELGITEDMVRAYSNVSEIQDSDWLGELRQSAVEKHLLVDQTKRHFMIFFDHFGCFEIVADAVSVQT